MKVCILTLGCKINFYESNQIAARHIGNGDTVVTDFCDDADLYYVNTCKVTGQAEKKSRNYVSRIQRIISANNSAKIVICGCAGDRKINDNLWCEKRHAVQPRKRAFIKVQDGCNNFCSYCVVPYLRGRSKSRPIADVIDEIRPIDAKKCAGLVISGIDLSSYGLDIGTNLGALCIEINKFGIPFELSSIEVGILTREFLTILKNCANFIPKFHIPLQSGSDTVLKHMNRKYNSAEYLDAVKLVREFFPTAGDRNAQISTDVIIGYPAETPADLAKTHAVIDAVKFTKVHTFPYSDRNLAIYKKGAK